MTNITPSDKWAEKVLNALRQTSTGRQRIEQAPPEIIAEMITEYKDVLQYFLDLIFGEEMTIEEVISHFENQYDQWARVSREDRSKVNYFGVNYPYGFTPDEQRAADNFEYHYRSVASKRLLSFFKRFAGVEPNKEFATFSLPQGIEEKDIKYPPLTYVERWKVFAKYREEDRTALSRAWQKAEEVGEIAIGWPEPPEDYQAILKELETTENPFNLLAGIEREDDMVLLSYLHGEFQRKYWNLIAGGKPKHNALPWLSFEPVPSDYVVPADEIERIEHISKSINFQIARRRIGVAIWEKVANLIRKHWDKFPSNIGWDGVAEQAIIAGHCSHWQSNLEKYTDRPSVVKTKIEEWLGGYQRNYEQQRKTADELAIKDNTLPDPEYLRQTGAVTSEVSAEIAERDARHAYFLYKVYQDFLYDWLPVIEPVLEKIEIQNHSKRMAGENLPFGEELAVKVRKALQARGQLDSTGRFTGKSTHVKAIYNVLLPNLPGTYRHERFALFFQENFHFPITGRTFQNKANKGQDKEEKIYRELLK